MAHSATTSGELSSYLNSRSPSICVVKFGNNATCPPCKQSHPVFHHAADRFSKKCNFVDVDLGRAGSLGGSYGIKSMPTFIYFNNGLEVKRVTGASSLTSDIAAFVDQYGKTVFETSQGKTLGDASGEKSAQNTTQDGSSSSGPRRQPGNARFNLGAALAGKTAAEQKKSSVDESKNDENVGLNSNKNKLPHDDDVIDETPDQFDPNMFNVDANNGVDENMVCKDGVCTVQPPTTQRKPGSVALAQSQQQSSKSVCKNCSIM